MYMLLTCAIVVTNNYLLMLQLAELDKCFLCLTFVSFDALQIFNLLVLELGGFKYVNHQSWE